MISIGKLLNPKIDYVFKRIFGFQGNEDITAEFISSIINKKVSNIKQPILIKRVLLFIINPPNMVCVIFINLF